MRSLGKEMGSCFWKHVAYSVLSTVLQSKKKSACFSMFIIDFLILPEKTNNIARKNVVIFLLYNSLSGIFYVIQIKKNKFLKNFLLTHSTKDQCSFSLQKGFSEGRCEYRSVLSQEAAETVLHVRGAQTETWSAQVWLPLENHSTFVCVC